MDMNSAFIVEQMSNPVVKAVQGMKPYSTNLVLYRGDKMETAGERLLFAIKTEVTTQRRFAKLIGMSANGLNQIVKGKHRVSKMMALATEQVTGVRAKWILFNELPKFNTENMNHKFTTETIFHFTCSECKNWWSIALAHVAGSAYYPEGRAYCPHCGKESITEKLEIK